LYVHIPFCERKCPYCDFNTYAGLEGLFPRLIDALCAEMARWRQPLQGRAVQTIFVGGGTPTVLDEPLLEQLFGAMHENFEIAPGCEITCEANPGTVDRAKFAALRRLGVNRLSMGVQSFQPQELAFLGRIHDVEDVYRAFDAARRAQFDNINLDFIFGLPSQEPAAWDNTLTQALGLEPEHLSLYSLIVEPDTPLQHWVEVGKVAAPDDDLAADLYELAMKRLDAAGCVQYEVSNWARRNGAQDGAITPFFACRHNLIYWRNDDYLGIGPGAHSHLRFAASDKAPNASEGCGPVAYASGSDGEGPGAYTSGSDGERWGELRWGNRKPVQGYIKRIEAGAAVEEFHEAIGERLAMGESMMLGLRLLREGVCSERFAARHGQPLEAVFAGELRRLAGRGWLEWDGDCVRLTPAGLLLGNQVFAEFLPDTPDL
jgi:oxygen-independent coproporphyrinogen-3 oxidase